MIQGIREQQLMVRQSGGGISFIFYLLGLRFVLIYSSKIISIKNNYSC